MLLSRNRYSEAVLVNIYIQFPFCEDLSALVWGLTTQHCVIFACMYMCPVSAIQI